MDNTLLIIAYMPDLIMRSKLDVAARHYNIKTTVVSNIKGFTASLSKNAHTILIDLDADQDISIEMIHEAKKTDARVVGFCSHVLTDLMQKAREEGADMVYTNSTITAALPGIISEIAHTQSNNSTPPKS